MKYLLMMVVLLIGCNGDIKDDIVRLQKDVYDLEKAFDKVVIETAKAQYKQSALTGQCRQWAKDTGSGFGVIQVHVNYTLHTPYAECVAYDDDLNRTFIGEEALKEYMENKKKTNSN